MRGISLARANNRFNASIQGSVGFNQTATQFGQADQSLLGRQRLTVGVNLPMLQWGAGHADLEEAKAIEERVTANNRMRRDALTEDARFSVLQLQQAQRNVHRRQGRHRSGQAVRGRAQSLHHRQDRNDALYLAQGEKDAAVLANVQALRNYWTSYYRLRRVMLYDFEKKAEMADRP